MIPRFAFLLVTFTGLATNVIAQQPVLRIGGAVPERLTLSRADFGSMRHQAIAAEADDQNGVFGGVALVDLLTRAGVALGHELEDKDLTKCVVVTGEEGDQVTFSIAELDSGFTDRIVLVADTKDGKPLAANVGPYQIVVPGEKRPSRWVRRVIAIDVFDPARR